VSLGRALVAHLRSAAPGLGGRIYQTRLPQRPTFPAAEFETSRTLVATHDVNRSPAGRIHEARIQIDVYGRTADGGAEGGDSADLAADEIEDAMRVFEGTFSGDGWSTRVAGTLQLDRDSAAWDEPTRTFITSLEFRTFVQ